ncbi:hypothetical protein CC85DRAFT_282384 [Cutaneotrichosporon oleaginosum]|uniref:Secreted protein n=1 Tax=Cutaneotrichosporon oleaginosum TaxID=879819 RepID=A0A0J1BCK3_9TREE|nr:uncharacterized protein CC85DRAFT_282384 [Cutaneotrichosporon oleaginosum]KLT45754.1 hypothetical protein CC85DRAFT_282384 [Cutaneotrichosporon oleaginosum]TXT04480.1 hypothetical protein COLE_07299 [Cutaneotrichosporon oleaginosum]
MFGLLWVADRHRVGLPFLLELASVRVASASAVCVARAPSSWSIEHDSGSLKRWSAGALIRCPPPPRPAARPHGSCGSGTAERIPRHYGPPRA